ncbi:MAG: tRNA (N(6)-L-threonylcarbamoyladenosine(37)-C(2))-methylthiotransferase MtaB [Lachnospiraceae bacterium]|nr:tRNA (N(6)-L-threonylcarbamoyladenosine(37)-C(2))-methylthiotransferase MtaB [Lachnospiraceae bacterium]MDE6941114.1 tRNA (N(6)-L-threonylcarbamoyladenosine(37)-C(2))-methylthiotransferase MtaB [Lachnospiraceae bacterium]
MRTVAYHNLGCKVNSYEMDAMLQALRQKGYQIVPFDEKADIYIVNTCTVTNIADRKSRQMLHRAKKTNPEGLVVAVGCYVQTDTEAVEADSAVDLLIGNNRKKDLVEILESYLDGVVRESVIDISHTAEYEEMRLVTTTEHTRAYIKIQDGCNQFCTYCMIPYARGRVRSRRSQDVLDEIRGLVSAGYKEFVLTGIHISSYGMDLGMSLLDLVQAIDKVEGVERIRLGSLEPRIVTKAFADSLAGLAHICPHFHLSLQSGCETVLQRMNRHYTPAQYLDGVRFLRGAFVHPAITTDVIVGFPGETQEEFEACRQFVEEADFYEMHIFKYSRRRGTKAAAMPGQVEETVKTARSSVLQSVERRASKRFRSYYVGQDVEVLFEEKKEIMGREYWLGHTGEYVKAAVSDQGRALENQLLTGKITGFLEDEILLMEPFI